MDKWLDTIKALSKHKKSINKLIDAVRHCIGHWYEPIHEKRLADARFYSSSLEQQTKLKNAYTDEEIEKIQIRSVARKNYIEFCRQNNLETIIKETARLLPESVNDELIDEDWLARFFNYAQDISHEKMQFVWANILSQEVAVPGTFSLRTLEFVKTMNRYEAEKYTLLASCMFVSGNSLFVITESDVRDYMKKQDFSWDDMLLMQEIGLVNQQTILFRLKKGESKLINYHGTEYIIHSEKQSSISGIEVQYPTRIGAELTSIAGTKPDPYFLRAVKSTLARLNWTIEENNTKSE